MYTSTYSVVWHRVRIGRSTMGAASEHLQRTTSITNKVSSKKQPLTMASRDLTPAFLERRATALKRRNKEAQKSKNRLTAGGSDDIHSLRLMEVRNKSCRWSLCFWKLID